MSNLKNYTVIVYCLLISLVLCSCLKTEPTFTTTSHYAIEPADKVEVVYFHRHRRCEACTYAEERISYLVNTCFKDELENGRLTFGIYDVEDKNNAAIAKRFGAIGSQLFINRIKDGVNDIRYMEEIWYWGCIDNEEIFDRTVKEVIKNGLYGNE
jgi:hypothetical protein